MKKIILCLFSLLLIVTFCVPTMANSQSNLLNDDISIQEYRDNLMSNTYLVGNYLTENLDPSLWGSITYGVGYVTIGIPNINYQSQIEEVLEECNRKYGLSPYDPTTDISKSINVSFVVCKYSQKKLNSIISELQKNKAIKDSKYNIEFFANPGGYISVDVKSKKENMYTTVPAEDYDAIVSALSKYKSVIRINTTKTNYS